MQSSSPRAGRARGLAVEYPPSMVGHHRHHRQRRHRHHRQRHHHHRARGLPVKHHGETPSPQALLVLLQTLPQF